jgi:hypothetical protein
MVRGQWLKGNAHNISGPVTHRRPFEAIFSHEARASLVQGRTTQLAGVDVHGTISAQFKQQIDAASLAVYLIVVAVAAIVIMIHPKPELIPLLLWQVGHPL